MSAPENFTSVAELRYVRADIRRGTQLAHYGVKPGRYREGSGFSDGVSYRWFPTREACEATVAVALAHGWQHA